MKGDMKRVGWRGWGGGATDTERGINSEEIIGVRATRMSRSQSRDEGRTEVRTEMKRKGGREEDRETDAASQVQNAGMMGRREEIKVRTDEEWEYTRPRADRRKVDWSDRKKQERAQRGAHAF